MGRKTFDEFVAEATKVHNGKYIYDKDSWQGWTQKVRAICPEHGEFFPHANVHVTRRTQCPQCAYAGLRKAVVPKEERVARLPVIDGITFDIEEWDGNIKTKIKGRCVEHGSFSRTYYQLVSGKHPCPICARRRGREKERLANLQRFLKAARERFGDKFEYDEQSFRGMKAKMRIRCPEHGWFKVEPYSHLKSVTGCRRCGISSRASQSIHSFAEFLAAARDVHGETYVYDDRSYLKKRDLVRVYCEEHGWFQQSVSVHLYQQSGCPACAIARSVSGEEDEFFAWLEREFGVEVTRQEKIGRLHIDGRVGHLLVDYHGSYWHSHEVLGDRFAHQHRMLQVAETGQQLIQVFDFEFAERQRQLEHFFRLRLGLLEPIGARVCRVVSVSADEAKEFLDVYHLAPPIRGKYRVGLQVDGDLVALLIMGQRNGRYEVLRYAVAKPVIGGFAKLFSVAAKELMVKYVVSFADARFFTGCVFRSAGFVLDGLTDPGYFYTKNGSYAGDRVAFQKHKLAKKLQVFDPEKSEYENCLQNGYRRVYDAGHWRWVWRQLNFANW